MKRINYHITTFGCQMNKSDSERIDALLQSAGFKSASENEANVFIFNLCSVRQSAIDRVWGFLAKNKTQPQTTRIKPSKKPIIILTGCILPADKEKFEKRFDLILSIADLPKWPEKIKQTLKDSGYTVQDTPKKDETLIKDDYLYISPNHNSDFEAYVPIMTGCNNFCAYCAVPYTRGRERSRPVEDILDEVNKLCVQKYKMITFLGQNVNSYRGQTKLNGKLQNKKTNFPALLRLADRIPGDYWLTFVTSHPKDLSDDLIKCLKDCQHLMPYLHLALQSGSDKILKAMNRKYTAQYFVDLVKRVRQVNPQVTLSTDIIAGFPGETKKDLKATADLMKKIKFDMAYIAQYSPRPGTAAAKLEDDVPKSEKKRREKILTEILKHTALENNKKLIGKTMDVLIENIKGDNSLLGKTWNFKNVKIITKRNQQKETNKKIIGQFVKTKIIKVGPWGLEGKLL